MAAKKGGKKTAKGGKKGGGKKGGSKKNGYGGFGSAIKKSARQS